MHHTTRSTQSDLQLLDLLETLPDALFIVNDEQHIQYANAAAERRTGTLQQDLIGNSLWQSAPFISSWKLHQALTQVIHQRRPLSIEYCSPTISSLLQVHLLPTAEGVMVFAHEEQDTPLSKESSIDYLLYTSADCPARNSAGDELRSMVDAIPQLIWIGRPDGFIEYHNQRWHDYTKILPAQAEGDGWAQCLHPEDQQPALAAWNTALQRASTYEREEQVRDGTTGEYRWFLLRAAPYTDAHGNIAKWIGALTDINDHKQLEQRLKANEEQWNILAETVPQFVWSTRSDGFLEYWNKQFSDYLQAPSESIRGQGWRQFIYPNDLARVMAIRSRSLKAGEPYEIECRLKDGQTANYNWFLVRAAPVRDATGRIIRWFGTCTNIESQKRLEATLRQNQERIQALMESTIIGIIVTDNEKVITANDAFLYMTGYNQEDLRNGQLTFSLLPSPESSTPDLQALEELANFRQAKPYETICVCKDGSLLPILAGVVALPHHPSQTIGFLLDNSARKELEQRKDDFISMASHELKTPLTSLKLQVQLLEKQLARQSNAQTVPALARIEKQARHLERLVEAFLDVSKIQAGKLDYLQERVDIDELIYELVEAMQQINPTRTITVHGTTRAILLADRDRLRQVFTNLISNATKYSPQASPVAVEISRSPEAISIEVRDQGIGVPREQREKIFERFYRAVPSSQKESPGLGMGLYIAAQIVKHYKGTISVEDARGKGSTFRVTLPPRDSEAKCSIPF